MTTQGLQVNTVSLGQGARTWIRDDAFSVAPGEVLTIMGPSGSGKSSLLAAIAGTLGNVSVDLEPLTFVGNVRLHSQSSRTCPHINAALAWCIKRRCYLRT